MEHTISLVMMLMMC